MYSPSHLKRVPRVVMLVAAGVLTCTAQESATQPTAGQQPGPQQPDDLQKQLEQLKQQYDATTHDLEQRIAALEQQIQKQREAAEKSKAGTVSSVELAA